jgi:hypothetical protein
MRKKFVLSVLVLGMIYTLSFHLNAVSNALYSKSEYSLEEEIELHGSLLTGKLRSSFIPFQVIKSDFLITVHYLSDLNDILIVISDESGRSVYRHFVDTVTGEQLSIDITTWEEGNYTIYFADIYGNSVFGYFVISD